MYNLGKPGTDLNCWVNAISLKGLELISHAYQERMLGKRDKSTYTLSVSQDS